MSYFWHHVYQFFHDCKISLIRFSNIESFMRDFYGQGFSTGLGKNIYYMLKDFFHYVKEQGVRVIDINDPTILKACRSEITFPALKSDIDAIRHTDKYRDAALLCLMAAYMGFKKKTALDIRISQFDLSSNRIFVDNTSCRYRAVTCHFPNALEELIRETISESNESEWLFSDIHGEQWSGGDASYRIRKLIDYAGCQKNLTYTSFRMFYASVIDEAGLNRGVAEQMMGLYNARPTVWMHPVLEKQKRANNRCLKNYLKEITGELYLHDMLQEN